MFSVIFEVYPKEQRCEEYLALAKHLKPILEKIDGFVDNERFESKRRPGWILSHSTWRDEKSAVRWRTTAEHHMVQEKGRSEILGDYHLRVGDVTADTDAPKEAPVHEQRFDETETGAAKLATLTEITPQQGIAVDSHTDLLPLLGLDVSREAADIQLSFSGELASARTGISSYPNIGAWVKRFQARSAYKVALERGGAYSFA
jgi:heme-degrading monooxygenase HmoA